MGKPTTKDWDEIQSDYEQMETMSCVPSLLKKFLQTTSSMKTNL